MSYGWDSLNQAAILYGGYATNVEYIGDLWVASITPNITTTGGALTTAMSTGQHTTGTTGVTTSTATTTITTGSTCDSSNCFCLINSFDFTNATCSEGTVLVENHLVVSSDVEIPAGTVLIVQGNLSITASSFKMNSKSNITLLSDLIINPQSVLHITLDTSSNQAEYVVDSF
jgi:hypothetical protein